MEDDADLDVVTLSLFYKGDNALGKGGDGTMSYNLVYVMSSDLQAQSG